ncbi:MULTISPECIES: YybS family protein [Brevibacillus]|jgi:uncharacterized protein YybS (DUF2232 family)|uniref:DUF2232 domain-containing protein n=1 Tax=Brevibacillus borstelensis AK1 TaxID=1300222 RepID=M8D8U3_9BACL|nr:DUF2232 domain-containing protein [Brevibacillus borstelensis]EMT52669.1 hypothetical protein I532_13469 [Brevibacillus borstelensis AK1]MBE5396069.1 DUF2232 domain-containing protein [Brevibacillus borstelensis]MCC0566971.1 YybS family protein [Brevibacillus borstelensis]MCM3593168.1 YybS family protein [Brevibacillus borstelensis]MCM3624770.1 YybS family protein [Brevibacillus borstelensis]
MPSKTKQLAENALLLGIALVLLFISTYTIAGMVTSLLLPLPFVILGMRRPISSSIWIVAVFTFLAGVLTGIFSAMMALMIALWGTVMGHMYAKRGTAMSAIVAGAAVVFLGYVAMLALSTYVIGMGLNEMIQEATKLRPDFVPKEQFEQGMQLIKMVMPAFLVMMSFIQSGITHWIARLVGKRMRLSVPALPPAREWSFPRSILYYYFISMVSILLMGEELQGTFWTSAVLNVKVILDVILTLQGLAFCLFAIHLYNRKGLAPVLIVSLFIFPPLTTILSLLGIFDLGLGLRKRLETRVKRG